MGGLLFALKSRRNAYQGKKTAEGFGRTGARKNAKRWGKEKDRPGIVWGEADIILGDRDRIMKRKENVRLRGCSTKNRRLQEKTTHKLGAKYHREGRKCKNRDLSRLDKREIKMRSTEQGGLRRKSQLSGGARWARPGGALRMGLSKYGGGGGRSRSEKNHRGKNRTQSSLTKRGENMMWRGDKA